MTLLDQITEQTDRLLRTSRGLEDLGAPSLCAGWTRSHVLNHVARNAEALRRVAQAATGGSGEPMYTSNAQRDADIEAAVGRDRAALVADLTGTAATLVTELARLSPQVGQRRMDAWSIGDADAQVSGSRAGVLLSLSRQVSSAVTADRLPTLPTGV